MAFEFAPEEPVSLAAAEQAIGPYLRAVKRYWILVVAAGVLAAAMAAITVVRAGKTYQSTASVLVTPLPQGSSELPGVPTVVDTGDPGRTMQTAAALLDTPQAAKAAAAALGHGWTAGAVMSAIAVTPLGASDVLAVTAQASSPADAARLANAFATAALQYRASVVQGALSSEIAVLDTRLTSLGSAQNSAEAQAVAGQVAQLRLLQGTGREPTMSLSQAAVGGAPTGAATWLIVALALIGGAILGTVAAMAIEMFSHPVRDREELLSIFELPTLASLPRMSGRRRRELPPWELDSIGFEQIRMLRVQLSLGGGPVIMLTSAAAGDGKTTVAAALAASFAEVGASVALLDLDIRKPDLTRVLGVRTIGVSSNGGGPRPVPLKIPELPRVLLMPAPAGNLAAFERVLGQLPEMLAEARKMADYVIIDTAPVGEVSETLRIAAVADQVVFVGRPRHTDRRRLRSARDMLRRAGAHVVGMVVVGEDPGSLRGDYAYRYSADLDVAGDSRASA